MVSLDEYMAQVNQYDAGRPNTAAPQPAPAFKGGEAVGSPEPDAASRAIGAAQRGISKVGESMSGTSGGVAMRGPEIRGNMPNSAQLQDNPFNYQQQPGMGQIARGAIDTMAKTSGAISMPGAEQPFVNSLRRPVGDTVRTFDPSAVENRSSMPGMLEGLNAARINAQQERHALIGDIGKGLVNAGGNVVSAVGKFGEDMTEGRFLGRGGAGASPQAGGATARPAMALRAAPDSALPETRAAAAMTPIKMLSTDAASSGVDMRNMPSPEQIRARVLEKNGFTRGNVPATARPGLTLSATPAVEQDGPRKPLAYNGAFVGGGPQARAEDALFRKRMEVLKADQASGQASRSDYVSPFETNPNRRAELDAQQRKNIEDIAARQISEATVRMLNDQATGLTSDRNLSMMPYAQRRAVINDRNNLLKLNADDKKRKSDEAVAAANRDAEMARAQMSDSTTRRGQDVGLEADRMKEIGATDRTKMTDATTRRGQDVEQQTNLTNAEIAARSKGLDREAMLEAARIRKNTPVDRVKVEGIKAYNKYISDRLTMTPELQNDPAFFDGAMKMFNLSSDDLKAKMMTSANPYDDDEFPTI